jgi:hypothetical protein
MFGPGAMPFPDAPTGFDPAARRPVHRHVVDVTIIYQRRLAPPLK